MKKWKAVAGYEIGTSHQKQGIVCQDYGKYCIFDDVIVGAVADGAGSAKHSDVGSRLAVETVLKYFSDINEFPHKQAFSQPLDKEEAQKVFAKIVNQVITELHKQADDEDYSINDLACTLLVFLATPDWVAAMQIGDGFIVVRSQDSEYQLLFQPDKGEFANETTFITSTNALKEMQVEVIPEKQEFICASTDGLEKVAIRLSDWQPFSPFFKPLEEYLHESVNPKEDKYLTEFLNSERLNSRTDDDKTLLLCLFNRE
ncbi:PP2C family serine/threonine-protein phosphatase [Nostoc sp. 'Lobaria pulmonaria (5183) cyanobiont']|uniref:PP2C family serine/threonine-protein phosphatase n=1 Tax=Nostoc sp. 'Lobaria pulmonaria (5183) cyanobiont' TaxID=1618022 RepID=UPI000CF322F2|nr:PP2C family serine/threonine-protein phosphatase [Nostoc sp. 'Lobaria pulmonaria (5183) cyanobiont']AVH72499.1 serine/threonine protein phosphatase [Nostoc sp. 'Lobaria pulmonaria (5183) cyanobiont']